MTKRHCLILNAGPERLKGNNRFIRLTREVDDNGTIRVVAVKRVDSPDDTNGMVRLEGLTDDESTMIRAMEYRELLKNPESAHAYWSSPGVSGEVELET